MAGGTDGPALAAIGAGGLFLYAAIQGKTVLGEIRALIRGKSPASAPSVPGPTAADNTGSAAGVISGGTIPSGSGQQALQAAAASHGWGSGTQWQALQSLEMGEAGFHPNARNPDSGAYGLAQALGHGNGATAGSAADEYGGFGLTDAQAQAANSGDAGAQAVWMCNYIAAIYGTPADAYKTWLSRSPHWY
jgi:hypothetical protein